MKEVASEADPRQASETQGQHRKSLLFFCFLLCSWRTYQAEMPFREYIYYVHRMLVKLFFLKKNLLTYELVMYTCTVA